MPRQSRDARITAVVDQTLADGEEVADRGVCWAVVRRRRVPLMILGRHQYDVVLTDRRILLFARRRRRRLRVDDVALAKRFTSLTLEKTPHRVLLQQRIRTDAGALLVLEWRPRYRAIGRTLEVTLRAQAARRPVAPA